MSNAPLRVLLGRYVHNGATGRTFAVPPSVGEALQRDDQGRRDSAVGPLVRRELAGGRFFAPPALGLQLPSDEETGEVKFGHLSLAVTEACNLRCHYCPYTTGAGERFQDRDDLAMSEATVSAALKLACMHGHLPETFAFYGGEPLLGFRRISEFVAALREEFTEWNGQFTLTTNLTQLSDEIADFLVEHRFIVTVSLDGPESIHDRHRRTRNGAGTFRAVANNLERLRDRHPDWFDRSVLCNAVLTPPLRLSEIDRTFTEDLPRFAFYRFSLATNPTFYSAMETTRQAARANLRQWLAQRLLTFDSVDQILGSPLLRGLCIQLFGGFTTCRSQTKDGLHPFTACVPGRRAIVRSTGTIGLCEKCDDLLIGSVSNGVDPTFARQLVNEWRNALRDDCMSCWAAAFCRTCYYHAWDGVRLRRDRLRKFCTAFREEAAFLFGLYLLMRERMQGFDRVLQVADKRFLE